MPICTFGSNCMRSIYQLFGFNLVFVFSGAARFAFGISGELNVVEIVGAESAAIFKAFTLLAGDVQKVVSPAPNKISLENVNA